MNSNEYRFDLLYVPGATNVRDIGGYPGLEGRPVNKGRFIRAGAMNALTDAGVKAVRELGVGCIADLRSTYEAANMPDVIRNDAIIDYVHIPMLDYIQSNFAKGEFSAFPASMAEMYVGLLENGKDDFLRLFHVFANPAYETILFHCTAGKDRTGLSAMMLLGLAGVSRADIVDDYSHSEKLVATTAREGIPRYVFESRPETMEAALDHIDADYGGIPQYLDSIGVSEEMQLAVQAKLLGL